MSKIKVGVIFGGKSAEYEVSLQSAKNIVEAMDKDKYEVILIRIAKNGRWFLDDDAHHNESSELNDSNFQDIALIPQGNGKILQALNQDTIQLIDIAFPVLHGPFGEDGTIQGVLKLANIPFVGASVLGSAVGMDKDVMKHLLRDAGLPIAQFLTITKNNIPDYEQIVEKLCLPFFVKPANLGSSVGVSKVIDKISFEKAIKEAFKYDRKVLIEEYVKGREIECAVFGNDDPIASVVGEIIINNDFYSYKTKYIDENGASLKIPAELSDELMKKIQLLAVQTFKILNCEGLGRVDFFLKESNEILINEINTIPGFTSMSMYPKLWEASGIPCSELIDRLIHLAM